MNTLTRAHNALEKCTLCRARFEEHCMGSGGEKLQLQLQLNKTRKAVLKAQSIHMYLKCVECAINIAQKEQQQQIQESQSNEQDEDDNDENEIQRLERNVQKNMQTCIQMMQLYNILEETRCKHLKEAVKKNAKKQAQKVHDKLRNLYVTTYEEMRWPQMAENLVLETAIVQKFAIIYTHMFVLQNIAAACWIEVEVEKLYAKQNEETLWVLLYLAEPIIKRFHFHFSGDRPTNRIDKPEWIFAFIEHAITEHLPFMREVVQMLLEQNGANAISAPEEWMQILIDVSCSRLELWLQQIIEDNSLLRHYLHECLTFERKLRETFMLPAARPGVLNLFLCMPIFASWVRVDTEDAEARIAELLLVKDRWMPVADAVSLDSQPVNEQDDDSDFADEFNNTHHVIHESKLQHGDRVNEVLELSELFPPNRTTALIPTVASYGIIDLIKFLELRSMQITIMRLRLDYTRCTILHAIETFIQATAEQAEDTRLALARDTKATKITFSAWQALCGQANSLAYLRELLREQNDQPFAVQLAFFAKNATQLSPDTNATDVVAFSEYERYDLTSKNMHASKKIANAALDASGVSTSFNELFAMNSINNAVDQNSCSPTLDIAKNDSNSLNDTFYGESVKRISDLLQDIELTIVDIVADSFGAAGLPWKRNGYQSFHNRLSIGSFVRDDNSNPQSEAADELDESDLSSLFVRPLLALKIRMNAIHQLLCRSLSQTIWLQLAFRISNWCFENIVLDKYFSPFGEQQFKQDMSALLKLFRFYSPNAASHGFGVLTDSIALLSMPLSERISLLSAKESALHSELHTLGLKRLTVAEARSILKHNSTMASSQGTERNNDRRSNHKDAGSTVTAIDGVVSDTAAPLPTVKPVVTEHTAGIVESLSFRDIDKILCTENVQEPAFGSLDDLELGSDDEDLVDLR